MGFGAGARMVAFLGFISTTEALPAATTVATSELIGTEVFTIESIGTEVGTSESVGTEVFVYSDLVSELP